MAKQKAEAKENGSGDATAQLGEGSPAARFREIATESYMFNVNSCFDELEPADKLPLVGYLLGLKDMPPIKGREWKAFIVQTTEPVHVVDREKNIIVVPAGSMVLTPATWGLQEALTKAALNPTSVFEVRIAPKKKIAIGGGQTMWTYSVAANPRALNRKNFGVAALLDASQNMPALPPAGESDVEAPF